MVTDTGTHIRDITQVQAGDIAKDAKLYLIELHGDQYVPRSGEVVKVEMIWDDGEVRLSNGAMTSIADLTGRRHSYYYALVTTWNARNN